MSAQNLDSVRELSLSSCWAPSLIASSPSFGGRGLEVRVGQRGDYPHPSPLPHAGEGNYFCKLRILFGLRLVVVTAAIFATVLSGCGKKAAPLSESEVKAVVEKTLPSTAEDKIWERVPLHSAKLLLQDMVEPRQIASLHRLCPRPGDYGRTKTGFSSELEGRNGG